MRISDLPLIERPRERAARLGVRALADRELLASMLGAGRAGTDALALAERLLRLGLPALSRASVGELAEVEGIGLAQATRVAAAFELTRRIDAPAPGAVLDDSARLVRAVRPLLDPEREEVVLVVLLTSGLRLSRVVEVARGSSWGALLSPAAVLAPALREGAPRLAIAHNHPGGDASPSRADRLLTERVRAAADAVGLDLVDHVIVTRRAHFSFKDEAHTAAPGPRSGRASARRRRSRR